MITILMPVYNAAPILATSINSILRQTYREFEFLILDDGSTDDTRAMIHSFRDSRIRYVPLVHRGLPETLNTGLNMAAFDIIARMDAGDISAPERLEKQHSYITASTENSIVACHYAVFRNRAIQYVVRSQPEHTEIRKRLALHPDFAHSSVMFRKSFIANAGFYRNVPLEDYDLWLRIKNTARFHVVEKVLHFVEYTENRISTMNLLQKKIDHYSIQEPYYHDLESEFGISGVTEQAEVRGWREYFYGDKRSARSIWLSGGITVFSSGRIVVAFIISFLPDVILNAIKETRIRFRLIYIARYFDPDRKSLREQFNLYR